jgi:hypothetical protein
MQMNYREIDREILSQLDVRAELAGRVKFTKAEPNADGWLECHAIDRPDESPSAAVCVQSANGAIGRYRDLGGSGTSCSFWDLTVKLSMFPDWKRARAHYAAKTGIVIPVIGGSVPKRGLLEKVERVADGISNEIIECWSQSKPPITPAVAKRARAVVCRWPAGIRGDRQFRCIGFLAYRDANFSKPCALILYRADGKPFPPTQKLGTRKTHLVGGSRDGWLIVGGKAILDSATLVWKVEGIGDALALAQVLPDGHAVVTNVCGATGAANLPCEMFAGKRVLVIGDADRPGQEGAIRFASKVAQFAEMVRLVRLPFEVTEDHGKDVRDFFNQGGTIDQLEEFVAASIQATKTESACTEQSGSNNQEAGPFTGTEANAAWPEIESVDELDLPGFPTNALPPVLRDWVSAESHATQTPPDLAALLALAVCGATIARRVEIEPRPGWLEPVNIYIAALLAPGNRKSAVFRDAMRPFRELETEAIEAARPMIAREQSRRRQDEARLKRLEKMAAEKDDSQARFDAAELAETLAQQPEPVLPRAIVDDATSEKLGMMLAELGGRIASMSPEGGVFDLMAGLYSKSGIPQFDVYLKAHCGDDLVTDRVSRKSVHVPRPALTCAYAMQPAVISGLAENPAFRGRGLLARFLYAAPRSWIGEREIATEPVSEAIQMAYWKVVRKLAGLDCAFILRLTPDALDEFQKWEFEIERMLRDGGQMDGMRDWGAKLAGATLRIAAIMHCIENKPETAVSRKIISAAIEIAEYLIPHAEAVLNMMEATADRAVADSRYLLKWIQRHTRREFTKSEAQHQGKRRFPRAEDIDPALNELISRGYIRLRPAESGGPGRPSSPMYEVNPAFFECDQQAERSRNSRNSVTRPEGIGSGNNGSASAGAGDSAREEISM